MNDINCKIVVNDVLEELNEENKRLFNQLLFADKCLKVLNEFKNFVELNSNQFKLNLEESNKQLYEELSENVKQVLDEKNNYLKNFNDNNSIEVKNKEIIINSNKEINISKILILKNPIKMNVKHSNNYEEKLDQKRCHSKNSNDKKSIEVKRKENCFDDNGSEEIISKNKNKKSRNTAIISSNNSLSCDWPGCEYRTNGRDRRGHREALRKHSVIHSERKYVCDYADCQYRAYSRALFMRHISRHEKRKTLKDTEKRRFECQTCGKTFASDTVLYCHIKNIHNIFDEPVVCGIDDCDKRFKNNLYLRRHQNFCHFLSLFCDYPNCNYKTGIKQQLMKR